jgi:FAD/FMN-containing dehydrogenase
LSNVVNGVFLEDLVPLSLDPPLRRLKDRLDPAGRLAPGRSPGGF